MVDQKSKLKVVIAGGGTSGWLAAAAIGKLLDSSTEVVLVESEEIGRVGVGEATIPPLRTFHRLIGLKETELMKATQATFKLGIQFHNWARKGDSYFHSFGVAGQDCWACDFQHFWLAGQAKGMASDFANYSPESVAALNKKMLAYQEHGLNFAYHMDAGLYAQMLRTHAQKHGVKRVEGLIKTVHVAPENGFISSLELADGTVVEGDLFLDCTGFRAMLIEGALNTGYLHYGEELPCDSAVAVQTELSGSPKPYTEATAHDWGWQWKIPLQHRTGNGLVYCSRFVSDDEALSTLIHNLDGEPITEPKAFKYRTGRRTKAWNKNCVALGLASGFLEPVESTSIHLAMSSILRLLKLFPGSEIKPGIVDEFNRQTSEEMDRVRNFVVLHYCATEREDTAFWRYCKNMDIPVFLRNRIEVFRESGAIHLQEKELFANDSWVQVMLGQRITPNSYHPITTQMSDSELKRFLDSIEKNVAKKVAAMPSHQQFIEQFCKA